MAYEVGFDLFFPSQYLKQGLAVSLLSVWVLVGLFFYLNHFTKRRYFTIWAAAWLFYALWLTLNFSLGYPADKPLLLMLKQWCVSTVALLLFFGSARFLGQRIGQISFGLFMGFLYVWSYYGAFHLEDQFQARLPVFGLIGLASWRVALCFYLYRRNHRFIGAGLLMVGFALWGVFHIGYPFLYRVPELFGAGFFIATVLQLFIAVSMIVLVLEEAKKSNLTAFQTLSTQVQEKLALRLQVRLSRERYRSLFENAGEAIIITSRDNLNILELNRAACRLFNSRPEMLRGQRLPDHCQLPPQALSDAPRNGGDPVAWLCQHQPLYIKRDNAVVPVEINGSPIDFDGQPAAQFFVHELTERAQLEQQLRQAEKLAALGRMISGIAHELNNPLTVVKGYLELILAHRRLAPETKADLEKVAHESNRAAKLVQNFLAFAREHPPQRELVNVNEIIQRVLDLRKFAIRVAGVETELNLDPALPQPLADADQIQQVLVILVTNALQSMAEQQAGGRLTISTCVKDQVIQITVSDTGPGVPPHLETKIFEPFFTTKEVGSGTGLGLSIAHSIMMEHQGRIYFERPVRGACFILELPVSQAPAAKSSADTLQPTVAPQPNVPIPAVEVLVLDDETMVADLLGEMLSILGFKPTCCNFAPKALELIHQRHFDLILSDIRMPTMDGRQFYAAVREHDAALAKRIIFLTGDTMNEETRGFLQAVGNLHLSKPFQLQALKQMVEAVIQAQTA